MCNPSNNILLKFNKHIKTDTDKICLIIISRNKGKFQSPPMFRGVTEYVYSQTWCDEVHWETLEKILRHMLIRTNSIHLLRNLAKFVH